MASRTGKFMLNSKDSAKIMKLLYEAAGRVIAEHDACTAMESDGKPERCDRPEMADLRANLPKAKEALEVLLNRFP